MNGSGGSNRLQQRIAQTAFDDESVSINYWAVLSVLLGSFLGKLDSSIANVALPTIAHDMSRTAAQAIWVVTSYQLAISVSLLPLTAVGEMFGFRRTFVCGVVVFTASSLGCAVAPSLALPIAARALQGGGAAAMSTVVPALLRQVYLFICRADARISYLGLPFLLQHQLARTATQTGLVSPWPFVTVFIAPLAGRLSDR
ncbi:MFS transporter [Paraburkholderia sp. RAU2J]|uniref:MFS transporter n=1 Tax=Paraburkholderia sp. RAU2J TaxID=1938810 RepID=UPI001F546AD0|nr:MFS transporter [Paraburkholderia sp. RAU2J]